MSSGGGFEPDPKNWTLAYDIFEPEQERLREVLTSTGNGYFCTRGSAEWADVDDIHYPGTYAHRCYNRETTIMGGRPVVNEDLVNLPNWLVLKLRIGDDEPITLKNVELLSYRHEVDFRNATVKRRLRFRDRRDRETTLSSRRCGQRAALASLHGSRWKRSEWDGCRRSEADGQRGWAPARRRLCQSWPAACACPRDRQTRRSRRSVDRCRW